VSSIAGCSLKAVPTGRIVITYDVSALTEMDEHALDALARLLLVARRAGASIELQNVRRPLLDLLTFVGLAEELHLEPNRQIPNRQIKEREQVGIDEEVDGGDPPA
jgi:ABC-type transporter Mla MlaB component